MSLKSRNLEAENRVKNVERLSKGSQNWSETVKKGFESLEKWTENFRKLVEMRNYQKIF